VTRPRGIVIDSSVALALVRGEPLADDLYATLRRLRLESPALFVPSLFWLELVNVLARRHRWSSAEILEAVYELDQLGLVTIAPDQPTLLLVIDLVERFGLTAYDAAYLALAETVDGGLLTLDADLAAAAGRRAIPAAGGPAERPTAYQRRVRWSEWPGAAAYLKTLRARVAGDRGRARRRARAT
jgi:predicted nucleic acid-binding protein